MVQNDNSILTMSNFLSQLNQQLNLFSAHDSLTLRLDNNEVFSRQVGSVAQFIADIQQTAVKAASQQHTDYTAYYTEKLVRQFYVLKQALESHIQTQPTIHRFQSPYRFPPNVHHLPDHKRLIEYRKALRALNEKLAWLSEQSYLAPPEIRQHYLFQISDTELRKQRCIAQIEVLEGKL